MSKRRGWNFYEIDSVTCTVVSTSRYDIYGSSSYATNARNWANALTPGKIYAIAVMDEGSRYLDTATEESLETCFGLTSLNTIGHRDSFAAIAISQSHTLVQKEVNRYGGKAIVSWTFEPNLGMYVGGFHPSGYQIPWDWQTLVVTGAGDTATSTTGTQTYYVNGKMVGTSDKACSGTTLSTIAYPAQGPGNI